MAAARRRDHLARCLSGAGAAAHGGARPSASCSIGAERRAQRRRPRRCRRRARDDARRFDLSHPGAADARARPRPGADGRRDDAAARGRRGGPRATRISARVGIAEHRALPSSRWSRSSTTACQRLRRRAPGPIAVDNFRWIADVVILLGDDRRDRAVAWTTTTREGIDAGRDRTCCPARVVGHDAARRGARSDDRLPRHRADVDRGLRARRHQPPQRAVGRRRAQVFPARRVLDGVPALRHRARLRRHRRDESHDDRRRASRVSISAAARCCSIGIALLLVGFGFKVAAVPFHMWAPDVYEGAPTPITAYMAATVKAAAFAAFLRVWLEAFPARSTAWHRRSSVARRSRRWSSATRSALAQQNLKRMLAYSSIAHAGYILVAHRGRARAQGASAMLFYLFAYTLATFGAFAVVVALGATGERPCTLDELRRAVDACARGSRSAMAVFMLALLGFPIFGGAGFFAKWYVLQAALQAPAPQTMLAVVLVLTTVISAGYYLYVVMVMFMRPRAGDAPVPHAAGGLTQFVIGVARRADPRHRRRAGLRRARGAPRTSVAGDRCRRPHRACTAPLAGDRAAERATRRRRAGPRQRPPFRFRAASHGHLRRHLSAVRHPRHRRPAISRPKPRAPSAARTRRTCASSGVARRGRRRPRQPAERRRRCATRSSTGSPSAGVDVVDIGVVPTPLLYWACTTSPSSAASRSPARTIPPEYNGFKLSLGTASMHGDDIQRSVSAHRRRGGSRAGKGSVRDEAVIDRYVDDIVARIGTLSRPHAASSYDCGNGAGALVAPQLFARARRARHAACSARATARSRTIIPIRPSPRTSRTSSRAVQRDGAELGIAFDGDADRIGVVDDDGDDRLGRPHSDPLRARRARAHGARGSRSSST